MILTLDNYVKRRFIMEKKEWKKPVLTVLELTDDIILASPCNDCSSYYCSLVGDETCATVY